MCGACVIDEVKTSMLSRRSLFGLGAAAGAAGLLGASAKPANAATSPVSVSTITDLTHELHADFPTYPGQSGFAMERKYAIDKDGYNLFVLTIDEHTGTHMDAPLHFSADGTSVAEIPVEKLMAPLVVVDIRDKAAASPDAQVTPDDIKAWISAHGPLPENCCVAMNSGWSQHVATAKFRNADDAKVMHFPGFHVEAMKLLMEESTAIGIAVDTLSLDFGSSPDFVGHKTWLPSGRWGLECVAGLDALPAKGATIVVGAPKHRGGTGGPSRVFALT
ncbi:cyclase [Aureimonas sp. Leaf454]|uniref:cyclase family protein n=1 Tax=Aureimonas sp. Leaf454 TaxID=1736381 RepID=UPI0006FD1BE5|nr:cyclase family protein [Aureimonas sp. Leaf454]KQT47481.1 cyclase [Aureimonas sp. Leaf454]